MATAKTSTVLEPTDEYSHDPGDAPNYNESMYFNAFDLQREIGGWFRIGNRVNEGYAEMSVCLYLPGGRVAFMFARPHITTNDALDAGGLRVDVVEPLARLRVAYEGEVVVLAEPEQMVDPRRAFRENPHAPARVVLDFRGVSPVWGGKPVRADGSELEVDPTQSFATAHYEQHMAVSGTITVGDETFTLDGLGLRDKSWGPRYWQAIAWYRWLPMVFGDDFAMMLTAQGRGEDGRDRRSAGMVLRDGVYDLVTECTIDSDWDEHQQPRAMRCWARTESGEEYEVHGEVLSLIPLRNRRRSPDGAELFTRITEAMTRYRCGDRNGLGMSEYLDQVVDGRPVGPDIP